MSARFLFVSWLDKAGYSLKVNTSMLLSFPPSYFQQHPLLILDTNKIKPDSYSEFSDTSKMGTSKQPAVS